jgi:hypothetical protein
METTIQEMPKEPTAYGIKFTSRSIDLHSMNGLERVFEALEIKNGSPNSNDRFYVFKNSMARGRRGTGMRRSRKNKGFISHITIPKGFKYLTYTNNVFESVAEPQPATLSLPVFHNPLKEVKSLTLSHSTCIHADKMDELVPQGCLKCSFEESNSILVFESNEGIKTIKFNVQKKKKAGKVIEVVVVTPTVFVLGLMPNTSMAYVCFETRCDALNFLNIDVPKAKGGWIHVGSPVWSEHLQCHLVFYNP